MSWLLYLPTRELADALQASRNEPTNAVLEVSGNWDTARLPQTDTFPLQPIAPQPVEERAYG